MSSKKYEIIEHTADIGIRACGRNLAEAFSNAAYGMFSLITDLRKVRQVVSREIELVENSPEDLLYEWLNYLIYLFDAEQIVFKKFYIVEFDGHRLKAICRGEKVDPSRHIIKTGIKAATYHLLKVDPEKNQVQVIFDI